MKENDRRKGNSGRRPYSNNVAFSRYNLTEERLKKKLSQRQVAEMCDISRSTYTKIESGIAKGSKNFWQKMEEIFNKDQSYLKGD